MSRTFIASDLRGKTYLEKQERNAGEVQFELKYDRVSEVKAFDGTKAGVKGLVDAGISEVPRILHVPPDTFGETDVPSATLFRILVIDLQGARDDPEEMKVRVRTFFEQDDELKKQYYTRDNTEKVVYKSNFDLPTAPAANWRDSVYCDMAPDPPKPEELPAPFRLCKGSRSAVPLLSGMSAAGFDYGGEQTCRQ
ncbi:1-aminocyclopropane-1-carboxylate oxidase homolog [Hibiscus syriacus]|uniref:1-aminocyclopropane-1-carboxylate oxidase homolog n=1 Tax=Hibiscus syriacus TaxID=106335 RepID=UPI001920B3BC|nr:1-aminocyclopropane-1-carboxylate oxidase homolog [Hibiscus syriacus]